MAHHERSSDKHHAEQSLGNAESLFTRMREKGEHFEHELKRYSDTVDTYIRKNPVKSTIMAGIAGLLLGKLLSK
jgi:ElaB/YqjD/DUF883 family membrane-anchored ribosome-binding protein